MPQTIQCQKCGLVLNLPARVTAGKRLKCPRCEHRFVLSDSDASSASTLPGQADAAMASTHELTRRPPSRDDVPIPTAEKDLRETFDLASLTGGEKSRPSSSGAQPVSDAAALFRDDAVPRKKVTAADARAQARRCKTCGGYVPAGMSICTSCGLDQETGQRTHIGMDDDLLPKPPPRPTGPPLHIAITSLISGLGALTLTVLALVKSVRVEPGFYQYGWIAVALIAGVGIYGAVQFYFGKTVRFLMLALTLCVFADLAGLIAEPLIRENFASADQVVKKAENNESTKADDPDFRLLSIEERIDAEKIKLGVFLIVAYAVFSVYLMSQPVKRYIIRMNLPREF